MSANASNPETQAVEADVQAVLDKMMDVLLTNIQDYDPTDSEVSKSDSNDGAQDLGTEAEEVLDGSGAPQVVDYYVRLPVQDFEEGSSNISRNETPTDDEILPESFSNIIIMDLGDDDDDVTSSSDEAAEDDVFLPRDPSDELLDEARLRAEIEFLERILIFFRDAVILEGNDFYEQQGGGDYLHDLDGDGQ